MVTLYGQASNAFIIPQTYQKRSDYVILRKSCSYHSAYKLQDKTEYGWTKTTLISSASHLNLGLKLRLGG